MMFQSKKIKSPLWLALLMTTSTVFSQSNNSYNQGFQQEFFRGILPSARTEAMGKTDVALGGSIAGTINNPASISTIVNQELHVSTSAPFYIANNANYFYGGFARRLSSKWVVGLSVNSFHMGENPFVLDIDFVDYKVDQPRSTNVSLSTSYEVLKGLHVGLNANAYNWKNFDDVDASNTIFIDAGLLYSRSVGESSSAQGGVSLSNFTGADITFYSPVGSSSSNYLPQNLRIGVAYIVTTNFKMPGAQPGPLQVTGTAAYHNVINSETLEGFSVGAEALVYNILALRMGYFQFGVDDRGVPNNRSVIKSITYGFGVKLPLNALFKRTLPFDTRFDFTSLKLAPYVKSGRRLPNFRNFSLNLYWNERDEKSTDEK